MAELSGFFESQWDESLQNPETGSNGDWDRKYLAENFADYFSLIVKNGVFISPTNQLKVIAGEGLQVIVKEGFAFINGYWYHNEGDLSLTVPSNATSSSRTDSVRVRLNMSTRKISSVYFADDINVVRNDTYYDLKIAEVIVPAVTSQISNSMITDTRTNENVCGFVKGLLEVETTKDLFDQFEAIFNEWFNDIKGQITEDMAVRLQQEINEKENAFSKNTAFNKNFGNSAGTVCEGNDPRLADSRKASDVYPWAKQSEKPTYTKQEIGLGNVDNTADENKSVANAAVLKNARNIGNASFNGSKDITLKEMGVKEIVYSSFEPETVADNTIVFVYEE